MADSSLAQAPGHSGMPYGALVKGEPIVNRAVVLSPWGVTIKWGPR